MYECARSVICIPIFTIQVPPTKPHACVYVHSLCVCMYVSELDRGVSTWEVVLLCVNVMGGCLHRINKPVNNCFVHTCTPLILNFWLVAV